MNFEVIQNYIPLFEEAMWLTLRIGWEGILGAIAVGLAVALVRFFRVPVLRPIAHAYVEFFRNTPLLIHLFFIYFGLPRLGFSIGPEACGVLGLALLGGAYMAESFRSGLEAVSESQKESAMALGMTKSQMMLHVLLPQAITLAMPSFIANIIFLLKETSVFSAISLMDLMFLAKDLIGLYYKTTECLFLLVVFYLIIVLPVSIIGSIVERRLRRGAFGD